MIVAGTDSVAPAFFPVFHLSRRTSGVRRAPHGPAEALPDPNQDEGASG